jgi:outer membrane protein OmpA-like peptidoglycan-associated protein
VKHGFYLPILIFILAANIFALPIGDPRTPDEYTRSQIETPVSQGIHELSVHAFIGASKIDYPDIGGTQFSPGFGAAITYNYFFVPNWSFIIGGGLQLFNNRGTEVNRNFSGSMETNDLLDHGLGSTAGRDAVILEYDFQGYEETQWALMLMVPVMFQYQTNETRNKALYYAMGVKLGFPFAGAYKGQAESASIKGCYTEIGACSSNPDLGFGDFGGVNSQQKLKLGTAFFAATEIGVKWRIYNMLAVYTGFWMDWAINDVAIRSSGDQPFTWTPTEGVSDDQKTPKAAINFKSRTNGMAIPVAMGFALRFSFGAGDHHALPVRWIKEIQLRDSLLIYYAVRDKMLQDSIAHLDDQMDALLDSLIKCRHACKIKTLSKEELKKQADAAADAKRISDFERAMRDSVARVEQLESEKAARLADFREKMASLSNGLDDYKITQTVPSDHAREKLDIAAGLMQDYPDLRIRITGHTCDKGTHEANVRFGMQRAESARNYLIAKGINKSRMEVRSQAELEPVVPNDSEANRRKNRRVQLEILEGGYGIITEAN